MFEELLHFLTLVNPATSGFPLNSNNNKLINEAGSLCSSDSVEEEQSGRPIQRQISQSQHGKAKTVLVENNLSTQSVPFRFFIQSSSQTAHMSRDFPLVYWKLH